MAKRGPGKFDSDLDAALYELTLDGGADEEAGSSTEGNGWYGLMRDGDDLARAIDAREKEEPFNSVTVGELKFLRKDGSAGVIIYESPVGGGVEVTYYSSKTDLDKDWAEVGEETAPGYAVLVSGQHLEHYADEEDAIERAGKEHDERGNLVLVEVFDNASEEIVWSSDEEETESLSLLRAGRGREENRRRNGEEDILRDETIEPFLKGKGPVFRIQTWETGKFDQHRLRRDRPMLGYRITMTEPGGKPEVVYEGEDYSPGAGTDPESDQTLNDILAFFTSDHYDEEDDPRTARGKEVAAKYSDELSGLFEEREENRGGRQRPNAQARFRVYLGDDLTDTVYFHDDMSEDEVKRSLVDHDGYDPRIRVKKVEPRRTGIPAERYVENRTWRRAYINDLPDGAFLYIEPGGHKDSDGRTTPRSLRHFPYKDVGGHIDTAHLKNALSRIPQSSLPADVRRRVQERAQALYAGRK